MFAVPITSPACAVDASAQSPFQRDRLPELISEALLPARMPTQEANRITLSNSPSWHPVYRLVALYQRPPIPATFDQHFMKVQLPLLRLIPGILQLVVRRGKSLAWGMATPPYYLIVELQFKNRTDFDRAMIAPQYQEAHDDMNKFAKGIVWLVTLWGNGAAPPIA